MLPFFNKNLVGKIIQGKKGRYEIIQELSHGGFGKTYLAKDLDHNNEKCVVKQLLPNQQKKLNRQEFRKIKELFEKEAQHLERLNHPQIPQLKEYIIINNHIPFISKQLSKYEFYIVEEYIEGHELRRELIPTQRLSKDQVWEILYNIVKVLAFVHSKGLIHRDIKPENIIRRKKDRKLFLIDLGSAKDMTEGNKVKSVIVMTSEPYTPMEQKRGWPTFTTDIYAVGMIGIEALTGIHPDVRQPYITVDDKTGKFNWRDSFGEEPSEELKKLADVIDNMVHPDWRKRYNTATQALQALEKIKPQPPATTDNPTKNPHENLNITPATTDNPTKNPHENLNITPVTTDNPTENPHENLNITPVTTDNSTENPHENLNITPVTTEKPGLLLAFKQILENWVNPVLTLPEVITIIQESDTKKSELSNTKIINEELLSRKVVIIAGISTALACSLLGFIVYRQLQPRRDANLIQTYVDQTKYMSFSIKYPEQWIAIPIQEGGQEKVKLSLNDQTTQTNCAMEVIVHIADLQKALSLSEYKNSVLNTITQDPNNSVIALNDNTTLNKSDAYQIIFTRQQDGCQLKVLERGTMSFKKGYYIIYQAPEQDHDKFWPVVEKMIDSFEIKEGS